MSQKLPLFSACAERERGSEARIYSLILWFAAGRIPINITLFHGILALSVKETGGHPQRTGKSIRMTRYLASPTSGSSWRLAADHELEHPYRDQRRKQPSPKKNVQDGICETCADLPFRCGNCRRRSLRLSAFSSRYRGPDLFRG